MVAKKDYTELLKGTSGDHCETVFESEQEGNRLTCS